MFFMMGITPGKKELHYNKMITCRQCGAYGRYEVYMTFMCLSLFFIPCFRWGRRYYVQSTCCHTLYELDPEIGRQIAKGGQPDILPRHLTRVYDDGCGGTGQSGYGGFESYHNSRYGGDYRNGGYWDGGDGNGGSGNYHNSRYGGDYRNGGYWDDSNGNSDFDRDYGNRGGAGRGYDSGSFEDRAYDFGDSKSVFRKCTGCGYTTNEDFDYCPKCGRRF